VSSSWLDRSNRITAFAEILKTARRASVSSQPHPFATHWLIRDTIVSAHISAAGRGALVFVGDSIVEGFYGSRIGPLPVINAGYSGIGIEALAPRVPRLVEVARPRIVALLVGTNDGQNGRSPVQRKVAAARFDGMVAKLAEAQVPSIVVTPPPVEPGKRLSDLYSKEAMSEVARLIAEAGSRHGFPVVDLHGAFLRADLEAKAGVTTDGVHLSAAAYERLRTMLEAAIAGSISESARTAT
jgi:lysophospholipase L1-like esterase